MWAGAGLPASRETSRQPSREMDVVPDRPSVHRNRQASFTTQVTGAATSRGQLPGITGGQSRLILAVRFDLVLRQSSWGAGQTAPILVTNKADSVLWPQNLLSNSQTDACHLEGE